MRAANEMELILADPLDTARRHLRAARLNISTVGNLVPDKKLVQKDVARLHKHMDSLDALLDAIQSHNSLT